jgi:outer membrane protein assembly factor BamE (lipoprotein component of BamABCDE complex)
MTTPRVLAVLAIALAPACTFSRITLGHPVQPADAQAIAPGLTKAEVLGRLGAPDQVEAEPGGSAFDYLYTHSGGRTLDVSLMQGSFSYGEAFSQLDRLRIGFDRDGIVRYVGIVPGTGAP